jgi:tyrosyl-tRNA synthetase
LQEAYGQEPQVVLTMPLLEGLDGVQKMSKSVGNYVGIDEPPNDMFGKLMSISDQLMWRYYELLSFRSSAAIATLQREVSAGRNPRDVKFELAKEIVARFHDKSAADGAQADFVARFQKGQLPADIRKVTLQPGTAKLKIANLLKDAGLAQSTTAAYRLIDQGAVRVDREKISDRDRVMEAGTYIVQVGKRDFAEVTVSYKVA